MIDYKFRAEVLNSPVGFVSLQKEVSKAYYIHDHITKTNLSCNFPTFKDAVNWNDLMFELYPSEWVEAKKINQADYARKKYLQKKISEMLQLGECLFITFTFDDSTLSKTKAISRRKFVQRYLANYSNNYVANIDFGAKKGREHYHAVIQTDFVNPLTWKYGALNVKRVHQAHSEALLSKYITKLTRHAIKETTKRNVMIYGRLKK